MYKSYQVVSAVLMIVMESTLKVSENGLQLVVSTLIFVLILLILVRGAWI